MKLVWPAQTIKVDTPQGVDPIWYERFSLLASSLSGLIDAGGARPAYEEGLYTPVLTAPGGGTVPTFTATALIGAYTRIGRLVFCSMYANNTAGGTPGAGAFQLSISLPLLTNNLHLPIRQNVGVAQNGGTEIVQLGRVAAAATTLQLYKLTGSSQIATMNCADLNNAARSLELFGTYKVN